MEDQKNANPFDSIFNDLKLIKNEVAEIKNALTTAESPEKKYYSVAEAAKRLNVAKITLYRSAQAKKIPTKRIGSRLMIPGSFVDK